ncbi:EamA domain [Arabidopsis suecica]|uniref:EamA domain n=1 Tax=Arabidopsis suecica TaxID=45249 RepID=A0A8T2G0E5_ARASU|nr:EamA domain [Arabidopsis suecica]
MASSSPETRIADEHLSLELTVRDLESTALESASSAPELSSDEIIPLLNQNQRPRINIFSASYTRRKPREQVIKVTETEISPVTQFSSWIWSGSRYSGLLCMALSSTLYLIMELVSDTFSVQPIPLFETAFMRCTIILILSYLWLKRIGQPIFGPAHARKLLVSRALVGYLSLFSFIFSIQMLPLSQAIVLSFLNPIMASIAARVVMHEKLKITDIGGLACSFFGVLFIFGPTLTVQVGLEGKNENLKGNHHIYAFLWGLFSSITGGITYCLIKAAAKASEQPVITVLSFGLVACPATAICMFTFESFVLPAFDTLVSMIVLGLLAFCAEVLLARGLQLEKISKAANVLYIEVVLSQLWLVSTGKTGSPGLFSRLVGCLLILLSVGYTVYIGPAKDTESSIT